MAYELVQSGRTQFAIDWSVVRRLVRSHYLTYHQLKLRTGSHAFRLPLVQPIELVTARCV